MIIDKPARYASILREKKLTKKFKNHAKKLFQKLLILLMR